MNDLWFISDTHFTHSNILNFKNYDGSMVRPEFSSVEEMNETMIERWNEVVKPEDKIYHLGDVGWNSQSALDSILSRLNGKKRLILGNHDDFNMKFYVKHFQKIKTSWRGIDGRLIFSHHPLYIGKDDDKIKLNVHGHIHCGQIEDDRYYNISVEEIDYRPIHLDEILKILNTRFGGLK